jgi:hypothetical protein
MRLQRAHTGDRVFDALGGVKWLLNRKHTTKVDERVMHHCDFCAQGSVKLYECQVRLYDRICIIYYLHTLSVMSEHKILLARMPEAQLERSQSVSSEYMF